MATSPARFGSWFTLTLAVPAAFGGLWLWLVPGGAIERARLDEQRTAQHALATAAETIEHALANPREPRLLLELDEQRRVRAPFAATATDTPAIAELAERQALASQQRGDLAAALPFFEHAASHEQLTPIGWLRYVDAVHANDAERARTLLTQAMEHHAHARCGGLPFVLLALLAEARLFPPPETHRAAWFDRFLVMAKQTPAAALLAALAEPELVPDARVRALQAAATIALRHQQRPAPVSAERGDDGIYIEPVGERQLVVVDPFELGEIRENAWKAARHAQPEWDLVDGTSAPAEAERRLLPPLGATWAAVPRSTTTSARLQIAAHASLLLGLATLIVGNLLLRRLVRRELQLVRLRADFVDVVSHELRTPLAALSLKSEMLAHGDVPSERVPHYLRTLHQDVHRLADQVERILDFGRLQKGTSLRRERLPSRAWLARGLRAGRSALRLVGQQLELDVPRTLPTLEGDVDVLTRALRNLLENAAKYAPPGSIVGVRAFAQGHELVVEVTDRGPGVPAHERASIFQPFVRGEAATPDVAGSGLGLALVAAAAQGHGGRIDVHDRPGGGAVFTLTLPIAREVAS